MRQFLLARGITERTLGRFLDYFDRELILATEWQETTSNLIGVSLPRSGNTSVPQPIHKEWKVDSSYLPPDNSHTERKTPSLRMFFSQK